MTKEIQFIAKDNFFNSEIIMKLENVETIDNYYEAFYRFLLALSFHPETIKGAAYTMAEGIDA